jgi:Flp pilus assembly protein TadG
MLCDHQKACTTSTRRIWTSESGSTTVEVIFVLLPMFAILLMTVDIALIIFGSACIQAGVREGVRYAVTQSGTAESTLDQATAAVVQQYSFGFAQPTNIQVDYYPPSGYSASGPPASLDGQAQATATGNVVKVTVSGVNIASVGPLFRNWTAAQLSASSSDVLQ